MGLLHCSYFNDIKEQTDDNLLVLETDAVIFTDPKFRRVVFSLPGKVQATPKGAPARQRSFAAFDPSSPKGAFALSASFGCF